MCVRNVFSFFSDYCVYWSIVCVWLVLVFLVSVIFMVCGSKLRKWVV